MGEAHGRIHFPGNPWPEGHALAEFAWTARVIEGVVWCDLHLRSANYQAERAIEEAEDEDHESSWEAPGVWGNYHRCTLSSTHWDSDRGFPFCSVGDFTPDWLDGRTFEVDTITTGTLEGIELDNLAFHLYLLGHDSVANHRITFRRIGESDRFDIAWSGDIALTYAGDDHLAHRFEARITAVPFPTPA
ncbi:hypothetical protein MMG85_06780 [Pseudoxanthomonas sp. LH2527]|uniref:hypothetical protein n=1 Tax=Pseudoxanthomonas sp. LH2527 TaxID=2923249 RepID=UPI001F132636|nr:hypothetical protein [Pseudoxanthomonas sp. LH2527]MCH6483270.1 hypothetical protein [Pseudoxanthomonas sp. LH2527]